MGWLADLKTAKLCKITAYQTHHLLMPVSDPFLNVFDVVVVVSPGVTRLELVGPFHVDELMWVVDVVGVGRHRGMECPGRFVKPVPSSPHRC